MLSISPQKHSYYTQIRNISPLNLKKISFFWILVEKIQRFRIRKKLWKKVYTIGYYNVLAIKWD